MPEGSRAGGRGVVWCGEKRPPGGIISLLYLLPVIESLSFPGRQRKKNPTNGEVSVIAENKQNKTKKERRWGKSAAAGADGSNVWEMLPSLLLPSLAGLRSACREV